MEISKPPDFISEEVSSSRLFFQNLEPGNCQELTVVCGGSEHCTPQYTIQRETFPWYCIEFAAAGSGTLSLAGNNQEIRPGTFFVYGPGIPQEIRTSAEELLFKYFVDFTGEEAGVLLESADLRPGTVGQSANLIELRGLFDALIRKGMTKTVYAGEICALIVKQLILECAERALPPGSTASRAFYTYQQCRGRIEDRFMDLANLNDIARVCAVAPAYLCRLFRRYDRESPYQLLTRLRMNRAASALLAPGTLVKEVAGELGFTDPYHFSRTFKRVHGVSPERFVRISSRR